MGKVILALKRLSGEGNPNIFRIFKQALISLSNPQFGQFLEELIVPPHLKQILEVFFGSTKYTGELLNNDFY
jgi:hypothetical protein